MKTGSFVSIDTVMRPMRCQAIPSTTIRSRAHRILYSARILLLGDPEAFADGGTGGIIPDKGSEWTIAVVGFQGFGCLGVLGTHDPLFGVQEPLQRCQSLAREARAGSECGTCRGENMPCPTNFPTETDAQAQFGAWVEWHELPQRTKGTTSSALCSRHHINPPAAPHTAPSQLVMSPSRGIPPLWHSHMFAF
jgi:hypothetical protein